MQMKRTKTENPGPNKESEMRNRDKRQQENLEKLVKLLDKIAANEELSQRFNMSNWVSHEQNCGTVACALGWTALSEEFPEVSSNGFDFLLNGGRIYPEFLSNYLFAGHRAIYENVFLGGCFAGKKPLAEVTAKDVADEIRENYLNLD